MCGAVRFSAAWSNGDRMEGRTSVDVEDGGRDKERLG